MRARTAVKAAEKRMPAEAANPQGTGTANGGTRRAGSSTANGGAQSQGHDAAGMASKSLVTRVQELVLEAPGTTKSIAEFLLLEGTGLANVSMEQAAHAAYTSKPSLVRFAKQLGFSGWVDFRHAFLDEMGARESRSAQSGAVDVNFPFLMDDDPLTAMDKCVQARDLGIRRARAAVSAQTLKAAADAVMTSEVFAVFGKLPGRSLGEVFVYNMRLMGKRCVIAHGEESEYVARGLGPNDCALFLSYTGRMAGDPMGYVELISSQGATVIGITATGSGLAQVADISLTFDSLEHYYNKIAGFYSCAAMEYLLDALYVTCYLEHYDDNLAQRSILTHQLEQRFS